jgi:hypothetical protein
VIRGSSEVIRGHQRSSAVISGHQRSSKGHQRLDPNHHLLQRRERAREHISLLAAKQIRAQLLAQLIDLVRVGELAEATQEVLEGGEERRVEQREECPQLRRAILERRACGERGAGAVVSTCMRRKARSVVLFWSGVPVSMTVCSVRSARRSAAINESLFLSRCASSIT